MVLTQKGNSNIKFSASFVLLASVLLLGTLVEARVANCRPLPQCCRRFVFSPACRGVAAKRNSPTISKGNEDLMRDPRIFSMDLDYGIENDYRNVAGSLSDEDIKVLSHVFKTPADEHLEYNNN